MMMMMIMLMMMMTMMMMRIMTTTMMMMSCSSHTLSSVFTRKTSVEGRQFSEDPIINYAGWGFIAGI